MVFSNISESFKAVGQEVFDLCNLSKTELTSYTGVSTPVLVAHTRTRVLVAHAKNLENDVEYL